MSWDLKNRDYHSLREKKSFEVCRLMLKLLVAFALLLPHLYSLSRNNLNPTSPLMALSKRIENTENAYIEDVLDHYSALNIHNLTYLAMGKSSITRVLTNTQ